MNSERPGIRHDYLDHRNTMTLRFILIAAIFVFHAGLRYGFSVPFNGHTCVALFFFLSGFGLEYSLANKENYMRTFLQKRTLGLLLQYFAIMLFLAALTGLVYLSADVFADDARKYLFEYTNWFILEMLVFYTLFFFSAMIRNQKTRMLFLTVTTVIAMYVMAIRYNTTLYYKSGATFVLGILWYRHKDSIDTFLSRWFLPLFLILMVLLFYPRRDPNYVIDLVYTSTTGILTSVVTCMVLMADLRTRWYVPLTAVAVSGLFMYGYWDMMSTDGVLLEGASMAFIAGVSCIAYQLPYISSVTAVLGSMSLELFLMHYATFKWGEHLLGTDVGAIMVFSIISTLIVAYVAHKLIGKLMKTYQKNVDRICGI